MVGLETFILLEDAARKYELSVQELTDLVEKGQLRAVRINRKIAVAESEMFDIVRETVGNGKRFVALEGRPIRVGEAAEKYEIPTGTLSRWASQGYIRVMERGPKLCILNEADVAMAKKLTERLGMRAGRGVLRGPVYST